MAQRRTVELIDDLDETTIEDGGTHTFALNGARYEIDLSAENAEKLREALAPFIDAGRRVKGAPAGRPSRTKKTTSDGTNAIRAWAQENGYVVSDRGRIAAHVVAAYNES
ncbi:histone-like nucleoid-structuring protein Lsr2 [Microbacterium sp. AGC85]